MNGEGQSGRIRNATLRVWVPRLIFLVLGFACGGAVACGLLAALPTSGTIPTGAETDFRLMAEAWNTIERVYVDRAAITPKRMTYGAVSGMVDALGDTGHSRFLTPEMRKIQRQVTEGALEGIGAEVRGLHDQTIVVATFDNSPARRAGLQPGDIILKVDAEPVSGLPLDEVVGRIVGPANTAVQLTVLTPSTHTTRDLKLVRARITLHNVTWQHLPGTPLAHVRIASFSNGVTGDLRKALTDIQHEGLTGLILDLRNDPGGLFEEAVGTASQFLAAGNVVLEKDAAGHVTPVRAEGGGVALSIPIAVLIDGGTASAAEIVAGALKDGRRATLLGETTVGTGTILEPFLLSDGSALLLATKEWLTPDGHLIWHQGIAPDIAISLPAGVAPLIPEAEREITAAGLRASRDTQLLRALALLEQRLSTEHRRALGLPPRG